MKSDKKHVLEGDKKRGFALLRVESGEGISEIPCKLTSRYALIRLATSHANFCFVVGLRAFVKSFVAICLRYSTPWTEHREPLSVPALVWNLPRAPRTNRTRGSGSG